MAVGSDSRLLTAAIGISPKAVYKVSLFRLKGTQNQSIRPTPEDETGIPDRHYYKKYS